MDLTVHMEEMVLVKEMLLKFCHEKELSVANTWFKKNEGRNVTYRSGKNRKIDFVLVGRNYREYLKDVIAIQRYLQHAFVVAYMNKIKFKSNGTNNKVVRWI